MQPITLSQEEMLKYLLAKLIDQHQAQILVPSYQAASGFWFGGGNLVQDQEGSIWLSGRYRNSGDARTGLEVGERGLECALFFSEDGGQSFKKMQSWW